MSLSLKRGLYFGAGSAACAAATTAINKSLDVKAFEHVDVIATAVFAFLIFSVIGTFTGKIGSDFGDS
jgi:hypothetical protein